VIPDDDFDAFLTELDDSPAPKLPPLEPVADYDREREVGALADGFDCDVEVAGPNVLQLDLDSWDAVKFFMEQLPLARAKGLPIGAAEIRRSRNSQIKGSRHARVHLTQDVPLLERILMQALLGSDPKRELLCYHRALHGVEPNVLLFRPRNEPEGWEPAEPPIPSFDD
jgi:hypothetical protein